MSYGSSPPAPPPGPQPPDQPGQPGPPGQPYQPFPSYPPGQPGYVGGPPPSKARAGWALGLAIFPSCITWLISLGLSISVISDAKDGRDHGQKMAKAALIIIGVWIVIAVVVVAAVYATGAKRDEDGHVTDGGRASAFDLHVGDCLPTFETGTARTVDVVECSEPHIGEVYDEFDLDGEFTTRKEVTHLAEAGCLDRFRAFVGIKPEKSELRLFYLFPQDEITFGRDPAVTCLVGTDTPETGTLKGSKR